MTKPDLVGTWKLVSRIDVGADGTTRVDPMLGSDPIAYLMYDRSGHFAAQFMRRDRTAPSTVPEPVATGTSNNSRAVNGYDAYFGTYTVDDDGTVTQQLEGALSPSDVGKVVTRRFQIAARELVIQLDTMAVTGEPVTRTLRWERLT